MAISWLKGFQAAPARILINHGEEHQSDSLRVKIKHELAWDPQVACTGENYQISVET